MASATPAIDSLSPSVKEGQIILLAGIIQFVNILDFMMVMPLGPDFAQPLGISPHHIGLIGGSYTFAASLVGLAGALFLDQFSRKRALLFTLVGLALMTLCGALAWNLESMVAVRLLAGAFGGPLSALVIALLADYVPPERRGAAMGKVMGAFAIASVLGVPFGLELSHRFGWQSPFLATGGIALLIALYAAWKLPYRKPPAREHTLGQRVRHLGNMLHSKLVLTSYGMMAISTLAAFMIVPNISAHLQLNLDYPRESMGILYFCGGALSFFSMRWIGRWVDRGSATRIMIVLTLILTLCMAAGFVWFPNPVPVLVIFVTFMVTSSGRNVCAQAVASKIPAASERGSFMSLQAAVIHMSSAAGALVSSLILAEENGRLANMPLVAGLAILLTLMVPLLFARVERMIAHRGEITSSPPALPAVIE